MIRRQQILFAQKIRIDPGFLLLFFVFVFCFFVFSYCALSHILILNSLILEMPREMCLVPSARKAATLQLYPKMTHTVNK